MPTKPKESAGSIEQMTPPIKGGVKAGSGAQAYAAPRVGHVHSGVDIPVPEGTPCYAPVDGKITSVDTTEGFSGGGIIHFQFLQQLGPIPQGAVIGWGHVTRTLVSPGPVKGGTEIARSGAGDGGPCVHFIYLPTGDSGGSQWDGVEPQLEKPSTGVDPTPIYEFLRTGKAAPGSGGPNAPVEVGAASSAEVESISKGAALSAFINLPTLEETAESLALKGERSLLNDKPLLPFIEQLCQGSLRNFMSMPNGNFYAFIPDYFGGLTKRTAYWSIDDIEILDGKIELSDDALATHVYVAGDTATIDGSVDLLEKMQTAGVVTVFNAFMADFITGFDAPKEKEGKAKYKKQLKKVPSLAEKSKAVAFLKRYGARPFYQEAPMIRSHYFEMFLAYQLFCLLWSKQFLTTFEFTFMPELFPGGIVRLESHGIQCYVDEVRHEGDYEQGFRTLANLSAPSALSSETSPVHEGMVRSAIFSPSALTDNEPGDIQSHNLGQKVSN